MARLVWDSVNGVEMHAKDGEEIPPEMAAAFGQARMARELMNIGHWIEEIRDEMSRIRNSQPPA